MSWLKKALPWMICLLIFYYLFEQISFSSVKETLSLIHWPAFLIVSLVYFLLVHMMDCASLSHFISRFAAPIRFMECWRVRNVSYLMMVINYHAAQGAFAYYFKKKHNAPLAKTFGALAFVSAMDLILVISSGLFALLLSGNTPIPQNLKGFIGTAIPSLYAGYVLWILFWKKSNHPFIKKLERFKIVHWILNHDVFFVFKEANLKDFVILFLLRAPIVLLVIGSLNFFLMTLDTKLPWDILFLYNPLVAIVSTLPLTPSGLGTSQFVAIQLLAPHLQNTFSNSNQIDGASIILTSTLLAFFSNQVIKVCFGAYSFLRSSDKTLSLTSTPSDTL